MLPATGNALIIFFFCFGPGLVYENMQIRMAKRHGREFRHLSEETARVVGYIMLEGALFATAAAIALYIARRHYPWLVADPKLWIRDSKAYLENNYELLAQTAILEVALAMLLAVLAGSVKSIRFLTPNEPDLLLPGEADLIPPVPRTPDGSMPYGKVELKSGARYTGFIANHDEGPSLVNREIVLSSPITIRNRGTFTVLDRWASVVLPGSEVSMVSITNHNDNPAALVEHLAAEHERSKWDNAANRRRPLWARRGIGI